MADGVRGPKTQERRDKAAAVRLRLSKRLVLAFRASPYRHYNELAIKLDVDVSSVSCWTSGKSWPGLDIIEELADALGLDSPAWFWTSAPAPSWTPPMPRAEHVGPAEDSI